MPKPHKVTACRLNASTGEACETTFDVDGAVMANDGVYPEVIPKENLVFTDVQTEGRKPAPEPFMTAIITLKDICGGRTCYTVVARHRTWQAA